MKPSTPAAQPGAPGGWQPWGILAGLLVLTVLTARGMALVTQAKERARFEGAAEQTRSQFQQSIDRNLILMDGLRGLAGARFSVSLRQFDAYVEALQLREKYPCVQGLGFAGRVTRPHVEEMTKVRQSDAPFPIWPESGAAELCPVVYLAPPDAANNAEIGHDLYADASKLPALRKAAETGRITASPNFTFHPEGAGPARTGFFLIAPVYWTEKSSATPAERLQQLYGFILCSFRLDELFQALVRSRAAPEIGFKVYEGTQTDRAHLLYDPEPDGARGPARPLALTRALTLGDRIWTVVFRKRAEFVQGADRPFNELILLVGAIISFLAFWMARIRRKARAAVARHAEDQRQAEARFRRLVEQSIVGIYVVQNDRFAYVNPRMAEIFGGSEEELTTRPLLDFIAEESRPVTKENVEKRLRGDVESVHYELRGLRGDGIAIDLEAHGGRAEYNGEPAVLGCLIDVTERKQAEAKLQAQLSRLDLLSRTTRAIGERQDLRSILQIVVSSLEEHLPLDFCCACLYDPAAETLTVTCLGVRGAALALEPALAAEARLELGGDGPARCVQGELVYEPDLRVSAHSFPQRLARAGLGSLVAAPLLAESKVFGVLLAARRAAEGFSSGECEFLRQLSEHVALAANQAQLYSALQQAYDDLRRTQQVVLQHERLRALGQMASGIAHDINNAMSPAALYTEALLEREPNLSERSRKYLKSIQHAIDDVAQTVGRMREFYRPREVQISLRPVALNRLVQQVLDFTEARWRDIPQQRGIMVEVRTELEPELPDVTGVESEIRDALTNLIINAVDAMPEGGVMTLRTRLSGPAAGAGGHSVLLEVADTGHGMDEETRRRCLEPFYTTKGERGTGLGLAMVYGMIQRHDGEMEIESEAGRGTTARLVFPIPPAVPPVAALLPPAQVPARRMRLLIVDDDPMLIVALREILEGDGHLVTAAGGGQEGIDAFLAEQRHGEPFEAVFTDLGMPRVDGRKVALAVKAASATTPVLLLTGWGQRMIAEGDLPPGVDRVLSKPPKARELREALARCCPAASS